MFNLAQMNIARARGLLTDLVMADFVARLAQVNAEAERSRGFVWRYQDDSGASTNTQISEDPLLIVNLSVWESVAALRDYAYRGDHVAALRRRAEWFSRSASPHLVMWWIPIGHEPTPTEGLRRLEHLGVHGESSLAFTFRKPYPAPSAINPGVINELRRSMRMVTDVNLDGREFRLLRGTGHGDVTRETRFNYRQRESCVWATYSGGGVDHGSLAALKSDGVLSMRYLHAAPNGRPKCGTCVSVPEISADGTVRLLERWRWDESHDTHESILEEVRVV